jgi:uncharacterized protein GlcG (DUF336 family)
VTAQGEGATSTCECLSLSFDESGTLKAFARQDGAAVLSVEIAIDEA